MQLRLHCINLVVLSINIIQGILNHHCFYGNRASNIKKKINYKSICANGDEKIFLGKQANKGCPKILARNNTDRQQRFIINNCKHTTLLNPPRGWSSKTSKKPKEKGSTALNRVIWAANYDRQNGKLYDQEMIHVIMELLDCLTNRSFEEECLHRKTHTKQ